MKKRFQTQEGIQIFKDMKKARFLKWASIKIYGVRFPKKTSKGSPPYYREFVIGTKEELKIKYPNAILVETPWVPKRHKLILNYDKNTVEVFGPKAKQGPVKYDLGLWQKHCREVSKRIHEKFKYFIKTKGLIRFKNRDEKGRFKKYPKENPFESQTIMEKIKT